jgi:hypothetical protein
MSAADEAIGAYKKRSGGAALRLSALFFLCVFGVQSANQQTKTLVGRYIYIYGVVYSAVTTFISFRERKKEKRHRQFPTPINMSNCHFSSSSFGCELLLRSGC